MKKLITLIAIIVSVCVNCNGQGQIDTIQRNHPYNLFANIRTNNEIWNDYWISRKGDSLISAIIKNDTVNAVIYRDTIGYNKIIEYIVFDSYVKNDKEYFIYSKNLNEGNHYIKSTNGYIELIYKIENYYTTEPNTTVIIEDTPTTRGNGKHYLFYTDYRNKLTEKEITFFKNKYALQWYDYD